MLYSIFYTLKGQKNPKSKSQSFFLFFFFFGDKKKKKTPQALAYFHVTICGKHTELFPV